MKVFNKEDRVSPNLAALQCRMHQGVAVSATDPATLGPLIRRLEATVEEFGGRAEWPKGRRPCRFQ